MQYHLNGFRPGDPAIAPAVDALDVKAEKVDVLIIGCGPAGLTLAAQLSAFSDIVTRIAERKACPMEVGQADGIACRSMEMFEAFGFADRVKNEAYWVNEVAFWRPGEGDASLARADRIQDVEDGLSHMPHTILSQARIHDFYLEVMRNSSSKLEPDYNMSLVNLTRDDSADYPVSAVFDSGDGVEETIQAHYVVGCDGARSQVRTSLGYELKGEAARQLWGVMDVLPVTNFPDMRLKAAIQSANDGSILVIPREGGYMVRLYIELDELHGDERASDRNLTSDVLITKAQAILSPYELDVKEVAWWSAYEIGQRVCDAFDDSVDRVGDKQLPRIFIAGDACHTHSPKAGQGMNVSMADTFNLGWKLAAVLRVQANAELLRTYSEERQSKAQELIDFDRDMARLFSAKPENAEEAAQFQQYFKKHGRYTAGVETRYEPSLITCASEHQLKAAGFVVGQRFHSAPVTRLADAKLMELAQVLKADGRWRLVAFAATDDSGAQGNGVAQLCDYLQNNTASPVYCSVGNDTDVDSVIDVRAVFQQSHRDLAFDKMPALLKPAKGRYGLTDYEKIFCANANNDIFDLRAIDRSAGALVVVRPDQFVAHVLPLDGYRELSAFFARFMRSV